MKKNLLSLFVLAATMLIGMTASAQAEKASSLQTAGQEVGWTGLRNTLLGGRMRVNHQQAIPAKSTSQKARKLASTSNVKVIDFVFDTSYGDGFCMLTGEDGWMYIFDLVTTEYELNKAYTLADMVNDYGYGAYRMDASYNDEVATAAQITFTKNEENLLYIDATMTLAGGDVVNLTYQEQAFVPTGVTIDINAKDLDISDEYWYWYRLYEYTATNDDYIVVLDIWTDNATGTFAPEDVDLIDSHITNKAAGIKCKLHSAETITVTEDTGGITLVGTVMGEDGNEYKLNLVYEKPAPKDISINVQNATLTDRTKAGFWTIDGQTADKNNSFMLYFIGKAFEGTFTDVNSFDSYSTWVSDKSSGTNVYYENLSAVNLISAVVGDSLVIEGTLALADSKGNPANVTLHVSTPYAKESQALVDIKIASLTPAKNIESDGYFTVAAAFNATIDPSLAEDYMELDLYYTVTAEGVEPFSALANTDDLTSGLVNINIPNLQAGIEYTLTIDKVDVINYNKMDWETFEIPSEFTQEGNIASTTFTIPMDIKITSLTPDTKIDTDGTFKVALEYNLQMAEELKEDYLDATFYYSVTCDGEEVSSGQKNAADINDGFVNFYVSGLTSGKEYKLTVTKIEVLNYTKADWETFEIPSEFTQEGDIASVVFTISNATAINKVNENKEQVIYNLNGMRLNKTVKGVNIINGKKFVVR